MAELIVLQLQLARPFKEHTMMALIYDELPRGYDVRGKYMTQQVKAKYDIPFPTSSTYLAELPGQANDDFIWVLEYAKDDKSLNFLYVKGMSLVTEPVRKMYVVGPVVQVFCFDPSTIRVIAENKPAKGWVKLDLPFAKYSEDIHMDWLALFSSDYFPD